MGGLVTLISGSMLAPALENISKYLHLSTTGKTNMVLTIIRPHGSRPNGRGLWQETCLAGLLGLVRTVRHSVRLCPRQGVDACGASSCWLGSKCRVCFESKSELLVTCLSLRLLTENVQIGIQPCPERVLATRATRPLVRNRYVHSTAWTGSRTDPLPCHRQ